MSLKVFDLQCPQGHVFEGWFKGAQGFDEQVDRGLLSCPVCGSHNITRKLSAARLNVRKSHNSPSSRGDAHAMDAGAGATAQASRPDEATLTKLRELQASWLRHMRDVVERSEDVGPAFAEQALEMHKGQAPERSIRGTVTPEERRELADEGVDVLLVPDFLDDDGHH